MSQTQATALVVVYTAQSVIERDAMMAALQAAGIESEATKKDMHNRVTSNMVDAGFEGLVSISFRGFPLEVAAADLPRAQEVVALALKKFETSEELLPSNGEKHLTKYLQCCLFAFFVPVLFHALALYHLVKAIQAKTPIWSMKFILATVIWLLSVSIMSWVFLPKVWIF